MSAEVTVESLQAALSRVEDPLFSKPITSLGIVEHVSIESSRAQLTLRLSAPSERTKKLLVERIEAVARELGLAGADVKFDLKVPLRESLGDDPLPGVRNVVLVISGKGGVGKSTVATNIALALSRMGTRVGLLDADVYGPSLPTMFGIDGHPGSLDGVKIEPLERFGVKLMSIGFMLDDPKSAIVWRGPMLHRALTQFVKDVNWGQLDFLVMDMPPGTGDVALTMAQQMKVTGAVIVTTPQEVALQDVYKSVSMCTKVNIPILGVIENMSFFTDPSGARHEIFGSGGGERVAEFAKAPLLGQIPLDPRAREWGDKGTPVVQGAPDSEAAKSLAAIAESLAEKIALAHFARTGGEKAPATEGPKKLRIVR